MVELSALFLREGRLGGWGHFVLLLGQMGPKNQTGNSASGKLLLMMHSLLLGLSEGSHRAAARPLLAPPLPLPLPPSGRRHLRAPGRGLR